MFSSLPIRQYLILLGILLLLVVIYYFFTKRDTSVIDYGNSSIQAYNQKQYFFSHTELIFYYSLKEILEEITPGQYGIFPKTRLADLFEQNGYGYGKFNKIKSKHVDFLIVDLKSHCAPVLAIELNGHSHDTKEMHQRDLFVERLFISCELPFMVIENENSYDIENIKKLIEEKIN